MHSTLTLFKVNMALPRGGFFKGFRLVHNSVPMGRPQDLEHLRMKEGVALKVCGNQMSGFYGEGRGSIFVNQITRNAPSTDGR